MIPLVPVLSVQPTNPFTGLSVVTLESTELRSFPVLRDGKGGLRLGVPVSQGVGRVDAYPSSQRAYVSPDGCRIAVLTHGRSGYEILLFASKNLALLGSRRLPSFAQLRWGPDSDHLAYCPLDPRPCGVVAVSSAVRYATAAWSDGLAWSKAGDALFVPKPPTRPSGPSGGWFRYDVRTGKETATDFENVRRRSWLGVEKAGERPLWIGSALLQWTSHGVLSPFFKSDHAIFALDVVLDRAGRHTLKRPGIINTPSTQLYPSSRRVYYVQDDRLFDMRDAPDAAVWLGVWDPVSGRRKQVRLTVGNDQTRLPLQLTITE